MSFSLDMSKFVEKTNKNIDLVIGKVVIDITKEVVRMSPVGDASYWLNPAPAGYVGGRFRGNWDYGVNSAPSAQFDVIDNTGSISNDRVRAKITRDMAGKVHYIVNNLPYGERLENGWSRQAPHGMLGLTVIKFQSIVDNAARGMA
jgi:hypothetical protein